MPYSRPDFNGLCFGDPQGTAVLFIIPLASKNDSFRQEDALPSAREWLLGKRSSHGASMSLMGWVNSKFLSDAPPGWVGVIGRGEDLTIMLRWKKTLAVVDALRQIEQAEGGLPAWLCSAMQVAWTSVDKGLPPLLASTAVYYAATACSQYPLSSKPRFISRKDLEQLVDLKALPDLLKDSIPEIQSGTDFSRYAQLLGNRLLDEKWYRPRRKKLDFQEKESGEYDRLMACAAGRLMVDSNPSIQVSGVPLHIKLQSGKMVDEKEDVQQSRLNVLAEAAVSLFDYFIQVSPPPEVLHAFFPEGGLDVSQFRSSLQALDELNATYNHPSAIHLAQSLIEEADRNAAYSPQGLYRVVLPRETPLYFVGVKGLNIYFELGRIWVQCLFPEPCPTLMPWSAKDFLKDPNEYPYAFSLTLAAIAHDFRISPDYSFPDERSSESDPPTLDLPLNPSTSRRMKSESARLLPVAHRGRRMWGYASERELIFRRRHLVSAFRRHLSEEKHRREDALTLATEYGIVLPDEHYTIVLPHARGGRSEQENKSSVLPVVRSRGLAVAMAYENFLHDHFSSQMKSNK